MFYYLQRHLKDLFDSFNGNVSFYLQQHLKDLLVVLKAGLAVMFYFCSPGAFEGFVGGPKGRFGCNVLFLLSRCD